MANPVEGPSGHGQDAVRPPVAIAGVDASGKVRHLLLTSTGALSLAASSVSIGEVQLLGADGLTLGVVTGTGALKVDGSAVTQPVSGPLTDTQLRATPVPVSGAVTASWASAQHVIVDTAPTTAVTGTFWQTTQPVSGTVSATQGTSPWVVGGDVASAAADSGNPVKVGAVYSQPDVQVANTGQRVNVAADNHGHLKVVLWQRDGANEVGTTNPADALTNSNTGFTLIGLNEVFNGTSWDRMRSASVGDAAAVTGLVAQVPFLYNGATYDRQYGDKTNGAYVAPRGSDGVTSQSASVKSYNGFNHLFVRDQALAGLLSEILMELRLQNQLEEAST